MKNIRPKPMFSIVTCTYNSKKYISKNIDSVSKQTFTNYEHIFIDGYSNDGTRNIINDYKNISSNKVKIFKYKPMGVPNAFNKGIVRARGEYIIHLNSDDYFYNDQVLMNVHKYLIKHPSFDWVFGKVKVVDEGGNVIHTVPYFNPSVFGKFRYLVLKIFNYIPHQGVIIKRKTFIEHGLFDEKAGSITDYEYWLRIANKTNYAYIDKYISYYLARKTSQSLNPETMEVVKNETLSYHKKYANSVEHLIFRLLNYSKATEIYRRLRYYSKLT